MSALDQLLLLALATTALGFLAGARPWAGWLMTALYGAQVWLLAGYLDGGGGWSSGFSFALGGERLVWGLDGLGWFFAFITVASAFFVAWFAAGAWSRGRAGNRLFHGALGLNVLAMLVLLASGDLLSLFIGWELVSWAGYLIMVQRGGAAAAAAYRYLLYAVAGGMAVFGAIMLAQARFGGLDYATVAAGLAGAPAGTVWLLTLLLGAGFAVKMAFVPFHLWQAAAYAETPGPAAAFMGAIASRMGLFALLVVLVQLVGIERLGRLEIPFTFLDARGLWAWLAGITVVVPTYIALMQTDARRLLAWHGIGQGGYMLLGIMVATPMGVAGGLLHVINYAAYQAALFLAVTAVLYRTGTADLDRLGGLISRMPLTYVTMLFGIIALAGLPPMSGFVSKWLIYKALLEEGMPLLFMVAVIGTLGTILSVYKLIHNTFLGQLRAEHAEVREVPWSMSVPMLILALVPFVTGAFPGLPLWLVDVAQEALGLPLLAHHLGGVDWPTGGLDMRWVVGVMLGALAVGAGIFYGLGNRSFQVGQYDNYAGGHFLTAETRYHYSHDFYAGLLRVIGPWMRGASERLERGVVGLTDLLAAAAGGVYRGAYTPIYLLAATVLALWLVAGLGGRP